MLNVIPAASTLAPPVAPSSSFTSVLTKTNSSPPSFPLASAAPLPWSPGCFSLCFSFEKKPFFFLVPCSSSFLLCFSSFLLSFSCDSSRFCLSFSSFFCRSFSFLLLPLSSTFFRPLSGVVVMACFSAKALAVAPFLEDFFYNTNTAEIITTLLFTTSELIG